MAVKYLGLSEDTFIVSCNKYHWGGITTSKINALPQDHYFTETESIISTHAHDKPSRVLSKHAKHVCTTRCTYTVTQMLGYM